MKVNFLNFSVPFNWKTPIGYVFMLIIYAIESVSLTISASASLCYMLGSYWVLMAIVEDAVEDLNSFNRINSANLNGRQFNKDFFNAIQLYSELKE